MTDPSKKINVIKEVRAITNLGFKEAKDLVEGAPKPVKGTAPKDEANAIKKKLEDAGAKVSLKPAGSLSSHHAKCWRNLGERRIDAVRRNFALAFFVPLW